MIYFVNHNMFVITIIVITYLVIICFVITCFVIMCFDITCFLITSFIIIIQRFKTIRFPALVLGISRNPSLKNDLFGYTILGFALSEATGLFALMMAFLILFS